jgi:mono/diheme cytochrome c family protein
MSKKKIAVTVLVTIGVEIVAAALIGFIVFYSGSYDVGATSPHGPLVAGLLDAGLTLSVEAHARDIKAPSIDSAAQLSLGWKHYNRLCAECHGAPGVEQSVVGKGLYPPPPLLEEAAADWTRAQLYWLISNGVKDTGMPAFKPTLTEDEIWATAAFTAELPKMSKEEFATFGSQPKSGQ